MKNLQVVVSIDGLQPEHDRRRAPATYDRILKHIRGQHITVHCTLTRQQARPGYVTEFTGFWAPNPDIKRIWFSLYTPQKGESSPEMLTPADREMFVAEITRCTRREPKLRDMMPAVVRGYLRPPQSPDECIFSRTTACVSADLKQPITPCQYRRRSRLHAVRLYGVGRLRGTRQLQAGRSHPAALDLQHLICRWPRRRSPEWWFGLGSGNSRPGVAGGVTAQITQTEASADYADYADSRWMPHWKL